MIFDDGLTETASFGFHFDTMAGVIIGRQRFSTGSYASTIGGWRIGNVILGGFIGMDEDEGSTRLIGVMSRSPTHLEIASPIIAKATKLVEWNTEQTRKWRVNPFLQYVGVMDPKDLVGRWIKGVVVHTHTGNSPEETTFLGEISAICVQMRWVTLRLRCVQGSAHIISVSCSLYGEEPSWYVWEQHGESVDSQEMTRITFRPDKLTCLSKPVSELHINDKHVQELIARLGFMYVWQIAELRYSDPYIGQHIGTINRALLEMDLWAEMDLSSIKALLPQP